MVTLVMKKTLGKNLLKFLSKIASSTEFFFLKKKGISEFHLTVINKSFIKVIKK